MDNALDQHLGLTIVLGGDTNQLDVNELCQLTGWNLLVDFPTRGVAYVDNVLTNRTDLCGKCAPFSTSMKTDHTVGGHFTSLCKNFFTYYFSHYFLDKFSSQDLF